ncbi:hypothetical protein [Methyloversatilis thermotolerans]|uniref:hypothetical protein n=1 Tax=Methyloversatilis thermotolerans TaxID=1346290 RepID=UPI0003789B90|nr:hypothetical protein [Methyloversatilis thermotolerans]
MKIAYSFLCSILALHGALAVAAEGPALNAGEYKTLIIENVRVYVIQKYTPPFELTRVARAEARYESVEDALASYFSSMQSGDFDWNNETWTAASVALMKARDQQARKTPDDWKREWAAFYPQRRIKLISRVSYDKYVLVEYRTEPVNGSGPATTDTLALVRAGAGWRITQELAEDPILTNWRAGGRVQIMDRPGQGR